ncbi:hydrolase, putative [Metarhizium acridum CQMa 102]|uniref:Hydrolase, putative n=1 Tax=Metarhizium acridum (strain CQMa 102) TaxID=655827 RepID=E9E5Q6_METAQ|nr:hydrolase, putative [Metarhizium acridum CQMa 102]EFY88769.1 hydrolase, putative [Metarhizium acridum CQMa 102]
MTTRNLLIAGRMVRFIWTTLAYIFDTQVMVRRCCLSMATLNIALANQYTVIALDNRGTGDSPIPENNDYSPEAMARDLKGLLDFLKINRTFVFSHDKGSCQAVALAAQYPSLIPALGVSGHLLPGFGYEERSCPSSTWDLYSNWQLAFFGVPDAAELFIRGKEKEIHCIADENPEWVAERLRAYFGNIGGNDQAADLSWHSNRTTLV